LMEATDEVEKYLETISPPVSTAEDLAITSLPPWLPPSLLTQNTLSSAESVDDVIRKYPQLSDAYESVVDMLKEDSSHILRQANSALSKANVK
jgi:hypothetical protein